MDERFEMTDAVRNLAPGVYIVIAERSIENGVLVTRLREVKTA